MLFTNYLWKSVHSVLQLYRYLILYGSWIQYYWWRLIKDYNWDEWNTYSQDCDRVRKKNLGSTAKAICTAKFYVFTYKAICDQLVNFYNENVWKYNHNDFTVWSMFLEYSVMDTLEFRVYFVDNLSMYILHSCLMIRLCISLCMLPEQTPPPQHISSQPRLPKYSLIKLSVILTSTIKIDDRS